MSTICAIATAQGGAIGVIRVSGPEAIQITDTIFRGSHPLSMAKGYTIHYGQIADTSLKDSTTCHPSPITYHPIDDVIVTVFRSPHSYTGEDSVEISCHGSSYILQTICQLLIAHGCRQAAPGEYTQRAFLNGKLDLSQAEAVADLIASQNAAQHRVAMSQLRGSISNKLAELHDKLLHLTSLLELELDFSDHEDLEFADRTELLTLSRQLSDEIRCLASSFTQGNAIRNGIPVAIIGAPNVGKSTLLNALLQDDKAIVSDIQGTTRDTIEDTITINGTLFRFIDTAGIRHTTDKIETLGIERSIMAAQKARIIIMMTEPGIPFPDILLRDDQKVIRVINKSDHFQAINGKGLDTLRRQLLSLTSSDATASDIIITSLRHVEALERSYQDITRVISSLESSVPGDLIAEDLRQCIYHLSSIVGKDLLDPQTTLNSIFRNFCIGK